MPLPRASYENTVHPLMPIRFRLLQRHTPEATPASTTNTRLTTKDGRLRIRCPRCHWQPRAEDRWACQCHYVWNTFDTGGVCPHCGTTWTHTQCLRCQAWSRHDDWYVWEDEQHDS